MQKSKDEQIKELLEKGIANIYPDREFLEKNLTSGQKLTIYLGIDPTGPELHIGHAIPLRKLRAFQDLGHRVILLIGDFTALCGDPDKSYTRKRLSTKEIAQNIKNYQKQISLILNLHGKNPATFKFNNDWLGKLKFTDIIEIASNFTVQQMLARDLFDKRLKAGNPIALHEFLYPLMQAYDSVAMDVDGEIGGNDQTFNMLSGRDLMKAMRGKEKFVLTTKLLADPTGKKMGKTEGNMITLSDSPTDMFGKIMSWGDEMIALGFELCTNATLKEIEDIKKMLENDVNPRDLKAQLGKEIVTLYHSKQKALEAEAEFNKIFKNKENPDNLTEIIIKKQPYNIIDLIMIAKLASSKGEAKRLVEQNAVKLGTAMINNWKSNISPETNDILKVGKRKFAKLIIR
ncbi:tyrosine--tRNA ligase [Candidatus Kuenenbacteria bacterium]|nr:tyrosine--tRNA ligase [Candidatus Kuenenbacteria bacterium]